MCANNKQRYEDLISFTHETTAYLYMLVEVYDDLDLYSSRGELLVGRPIKI